VIADFIEKVADDQWGKIPGTGTLRLDAVKSVVEKFPDLIEQQPDNPDLKYDAALIYRRCANLYRLLGKLDEAKPLYDQSREIMEKLVAEHPDVALYGLGWCHNLLEEAEILVRESGPEPALPTLNEALVAAERSVAQFPQPSSGARRVLAQVQMDLADALVNAGRIDESVKLSGDAVKNFDNVTARDADDDEETRIVTRLLAALAAVVATNARSEADRRDEAREMAEKADRQTAELSAQNAGDPNVDYVRALALEERARVLGLDAATAAEGEKLGEEAIDKLRALVASAPDEANFRPALADILIDRGEKRLTAENTAEAVKLADEALAAVAPLDEPTGAAEAKRCLARAYALRGRAATAAGDAAAAKTHLQSAREFYEPAMAGAPENKKLREEAAEIGRLLAE